MGEKHCIPSGLKASLATSHVRHLGCHDGHELHVGIERQLAIVEELRQLRAAHPFAAQRH